MDIPPKTGGVFIHEKNVFCQDKTLERHFHRPILESYLGMGLVRRSQGQLESAKTMFEKALTIDPDFSLAKRWLQRLEK